MTSAVELRSAAFVEQTLEINGHFTGFTPTVYDYAARCGIECMLTLLLYLGYKMQAFQ